MAAKVVNVTNISGSVLVLSTGLSSEPALAAGATREVLVGIPSRPESFIDALVTAGLVSKASGSGPLTTALSNSKVVLNSDNTSYLPENLHDMSSITGYRAANRKAFFNDVKAVVDFSNSGIDTYTEAVEAGVDLDQEDQILPGSAESVLAKLVNQGITYASVIRGLSGNAITIALVDNAVAGVAAELVNQGLTYTAVDTGVAGDDITITLVDPGVAQATTLFSVVGTDITVSLRNTTGSAIDATAADVVTDFGSAPGSVTALIGVTGAGATPLATLAETNLAGGVDEVLQATTTFSAVGTAVTVNLRNTTGAVIDATATNLVSDFAAAPAAVKALISVSGSGATPLVTLAATNLAGATAQGDYAAMDITITVSGQNADYSALSASHVGVAIPAYPSLGTTTTTDGDAVLSRTKRGYELLFTDSGSSKTAKFFSLDPVNSAWELVTASGTNAALLVVSSVAVAA